MSVTAIASVDKGRRRRVLDDEGEDDNNLHLPEATRPSECESEGEVPDVDLSEYESAVDEGGDHEEGSEEGSESGTEDGSETESESGSETETEGEEYSEDEGLEEERQSGDGEEQPNNDKPDDDEDKKNPAYVPRKGAFYEHDLRQGNEGPEAEQTVEEKPKKKLWQDEGKWAHDRYSDDSQAPKSREELIAIYGYDIRVADKPPEAPPRKPVREKGPRQHRIKDFVPKMAVIDTTEDGTDSVPNLGDDGVILYGGPSPRNSRKNNMRNSDGRRGGRHVIRNDVDSFNNKNQYDNNKNGNDITNQTNEMVPKQIDKSEEFPSLIDTVRPANQRNDQYKKQVDLGNQLKNDQKVTHEKVSKPQVPENVCQNDFRDKGFNKIQQSQDSRKDNSRYQQSFRDDRRGGFNNRNCNRERENSNRYQDENWRSSTIEEKDRYYRNEDYKQDFNRKPHFKGNDGQSLKTGNSSDGRGYSNRASRYEQPPRYQQQQQSPSDVSLINESREYTNTSYRLPEDKSKQRTTYNNSVSNTSNIVSDGGDGSTSQNVVFSNKENVQTINVTITSTTTEKKSYAKERRAKGSARSMEGASVASHPDMQKFNLSSNVQYQGPPPGTVKIEPNMVAQSSAKRYSSQRQQGLGNQGVFTEPPPIENTSPKLYNPALPPPSYYREHGSGQLPNPTSVQEFSPAMLPPAAAALPYGLPVSTTVLPMPPNAQGIANPALFQPTAGPPPVLAPSFLPAGMMYAGAPRVPPPGTPAGFPISLAYASPPPPPASVAASVVATQPPQGTVPQPGIQQGAQHKKVYRGDITYYAPELQQPSRAHQKRPKAAIPIIDPQAVPRQKQKSDQRSTPEKSSQLSHKFVSSPGNGNNAKGNQPSAQTSNAQKVKSPLTLHENKLFTPVEPNVETMTLESESTKKNVSSEADSGIDVTVNNESSSPTPTCDSVLAVHNIGGYDSDLKGSLAEPLQSFKEEVEVVESLTKNVGDVALIDIEKNENFLVNVDHTVVHNSEVS